MQRFVNPHIQQHIGNMQQPMQQSGPIMLNNGMVLLPNGAIVHPSQLSMQPNMMPMQPGMMPMQPGMMPMQPGMMPMQPGMMSMPSNINQQPNINRFSSHVNTVNSGLSITTTENEIMGNRFQQSENINMQLEQQVQVPKSFTVNIEKNIKFNNNDKVILNTYIEEVKENQIAYINLDSYAITDCFEEAAECIIENGNLDNNKLITIKQFIISNNIYKTVSQEKFNEHILNNDIKNIYKILKTAFPTLTNKYDINLINSFNTILTSYINDYIAINTSNINISIDSFMEDFNDLLKVIRNNEEDLEDSLIDYMNKLIATINENIAILLTTENNDNNITYIPEIFNMCYVDKLSLELGINNCLNNFTYVEENIANTFINSLAKSICSKLNTNNFFLVTIDRVIVKFMINIKGKVFVKKIA